MSKTQNFFQWLECQVKNQACNSEAAAAVSFKFKTMSLGTISVKGIYLLTVMSMPITNTNTLAVYCRVDTRDVDYNLLYNKA